MSTVAELPEVPPAVHAALALVRAGQLDDALSLLGYAHRADPLNPQYCYAIARTHRLRGNATAVRRWAERGFTCLHTTEHARLERAGFEVLLGDWGALAAHLEGDALTWQGQPLPGGTLYVHRPDTLYGDRRDVSAALAGFGDMLMVAPVIPTCADRVARLVLDVPPELSSLLTETAAGLHNVVMLDVGHARAPRYDAHISYMGLFAVFGHAPRPPLRVPAGGECIRPPDAGGHVGLAWASMPDGRPARGMALSTLAPPLLALPNMTVHSLQVGPAAGEADAFPAIRRPTFADFAATARYALTLDCVVSVDAAAVHLAASVGVPTLALLKIDGDWRWGLEGDAMPWYPSMRLLRQTAPGDWVSVAERAAALIREGVLPPRLGPALEVRASRHDAQ